MLLQERTFGVPLPSPSTDSSQEIDMSIITKTILATLEIRPQESEKPQPSPPPYKISYKTRKLLLLGLPAWYLSWQFAPLLPEALKPEIDVASLLDWDRLMFGYLPHQELYKRLGFSLYGFPIVDFLMAIPYTIHVFWPIGFVLWTAATSRWRTLLSFANCFGIASFAAVLVELVYPTAPPWYFEKYGLAPANYNLPGDPGGLVRLDDYFQGKFYHNTFHASPLVFGAFPSLHVGWPTLITLFVIYANGVCNSQRLKAAMLTYFVWVCFAVVYLHHHYFIDVIGGVAFSFIAFHFVGPHRDDPSETTPAPKRAIKST